MISNSALAASFPSLLAPSGAFSNLANLMPSADDQPKGSAGLGVSTAAAPLISAPATRQSTEFQSAIAPPTQPANPAIAPPKKGAGDKSLSGTGDSMNGASEILAYIAAIRLQMASAQGNGPSGGKTEALAMMGKGEAK